jgi:hypothetical protein
VTFYENGAYIGSIDIGAQGIANLGDANLILGSYSSLVMPLNGSLDDVRIYNRALTTSEITEIFNLKSGSASAQSTTTNDTQNTSTNTPLHAGTRTDSDPLHLANAHTIFIDPQNSNCKDDYTVADARYPTTPWCTVASLSNNPNLSPGDTIYIRGGEYNFFTRHNGVLTGGQFRIVKSGTPGNPITVAGYPGETVTLRAGSEKYEWPMQISGQSYIDLKSLNFVGNVNVTGGRLYTPLLLAISIGNNINITDSSFVDIQGLDDIGYGKRFPLPVNRADPANADGGYDLGESWGRVIGLSKTTNVDFSNNSLRCSPDYGSIPLRHFEADGFETEGDSTNVMNITISHNKFYNCGHQDISIRGGKNIVVDNNFFRNYFHTGIGSGNCLGCTYSNNVMVDFGIVPSEGNFSAGIELGSGTEESLVFNNIVYFTAEHANLTGDSFQFLSRYSMGVFRNNKIYNNLAYRGPINALKMGDNESVNGIIGNKVYNNIFYGVMNNSTTRSAPVGLYIYPFTFNGNTPSDPTLQGNEFKNNIITNIDSSKLPFIFQYTTGAIKTFSGPNFESIFPNSSSNIFTPPTFNNLGSFDFHSLANSPQIGRGICVPEVTTDIDGAPRPSSGCDIGPYQTGASVPRPVVTPTTPVNGSCGTTVNTCAPGTLSDTADSSTNYLWSCLGSNADLSTGASQGTTASCSLPITTLPTPTPAPDTVAPILTLAPTPSMLAPNSSTITFYTDEPGTTQVEYGLTTAYGSQTAFDSTLVTSHSVSLSNLAPSTLYHYRIITKDSSGNQTISTDQNFTTLKIGVIPVVIPVITQPVNVQTSKNTIYPDTAIKPGTTLYKSSPAKPTAFKPITNLDNSLLTIPTTTIDIVVPKVPSWLEVLIALFKEIANRIKMGAGKTVTEIRGLF